MSKKKTRAAKVAISIRLRPETLEVYRRSGAGWQTRLSDDLDRLARAYRPDEQLEQLKTVMGALRRSGLLQGSH